MLNLILRIAIKDKKFLVIVLLVAILDFKMAAILHMFVCSVYLSNQSIHLIWHKVKFGSDAVYYMVIVTKVGNDMDWRCQSELCPLNKAPVTIAGDISLYSVHLSNQSIH